MLGLQKQVLTLKDFNHTKSHIETRKSIREGKPGKFQRCTEIK